MRDWKETLNLPRTTFPMKANLPATEPARMARWDAMDLYGAIRRERHGRPIDAVGHVAHGVDMRLAGAQVVIDDHRALVVDPHADAVEA